MNNPFDEFIVDFLRSCKELKEYDSAFVTRSLAVSQKSYNKNKLISLVTKYIDLYEMDNDIDCQLSFEYKQISMEFDAKLMLFKAYANNDEGKTWELSIAIEDLQDAAGAYTAPVIIDLRCYPHDI